MKLNDNERKVLAALNYNEDGICFSGFAFLMEETGLDRKAVRSCGEIQFPSPQVARGLRIAKKLRVRLERAHERGECVLSNAGRPRRDGWHF